MIHVFRRGGAGGSWDGAVVLRVSAEGTLGRWVLSVVGAAWGGVAGWLSAEGALVNHVLPEAGGGGVVSAGSGVSQVLRESSAAGDGAGPEGPGGVEAGVLGG